MDPIRHRPTSPLSAIASSGSQLPSFEESLASFAIALRKPREVVRWELVTQVLSAQELTFGRVNDTQAYVSQHRPAIGFGPSTDLRYEIIARGNLSSDHGSTIVPAYDWNCRIRYQQDGRSFETPFFDLPPCAEDDPKLVYTLASVAAQNSPGIVRNFDEDALTLQKRLAEQLPNYYEMRSKFTVYERPPPQLANAANAGEGPRPLWFGLTFDELIASIIAEQIDMQTAYSGAEHHGPPRSQR